ncbi:unnamed protein product [Sphagnum compactum]
MEMKKKKKSSGSSGSSSNKRRTTAFEAEASTEEMLQMLIKINKSVGMQHHDPALPSHKKKTTPNQRQRGKALLPGETSRSSSSPPRSALSSSSHLPSSPSSPSSTPKSIVVKDQIEGGNVKKALDLLDGSTRDNKSLKEENAIAILMKDDRPNDFALSSFAPLPPPPPSPPLESMTSFGRYRAWHPQESVVKSTPIYGIPSPEELEQMYQLHKRRLRPREDGIGGATLWQPSESVPPIGIEGAIANNLGFLRPVEDVSVVYPDFGGWRDVLRDPANVLTDRIKSKLKRSASVPVVELQKKPTKALRASSADDDKAKLKFISLRSTRAKLE